jgi:hypothetical protein
MMRQTNPSTANIARHKRGPLMLGLYPAGPMRLKQFEPTITAWPSSVATCQGFDPNFLPQAKHFRTRPPVH